jgi:hypothetical protein
MVVEVQDLNATKLYKIAKLNLRGKAKEWFKKLNLTPTNGKKLHTYIMQKYGNIDANEIWLKVNAIKKEPKEKVQKYYERLDKLFQWVKYRMKNSIIDIWKN